MQQSSLYHPRRQWSCRHISRIKYFFFSSRRRHTRFSGVMEFRRVLFRSLARPLVRFLSGVGTVRHAEGLRGMLLELAQAKALQIRKTAVERIETDGKGWSVRLAGARDPVLADALIDASVDLSGAE